MTEDYLKSLPVADVAAWYYRLADSIAINKVENSEPLASVCRTHSGITPDSVTASFHPLLA